MPLFRRRYNAPGAAPGSIAESDAQHATRFRLMKYGGGQFEESEGATEEDIALARAAGGVTWIDVRGLEDSAVIRDLCGALGVHPLATADILNIGQRPKVESYESGTFLVLRRVLSFDTPGPDWEQVSVFWSGDLVLTVQESPEDAVANVRERIRARRERIHAMSADYLACMILDSIVDEYFPALEAMGDRLEDLEDLVLASPSEDVFHRIYTERRRISGLRRVIWPTREAASSLISDTQLAVSAASRVYVRDTKDHLMQLVEVLESYREISAALVELYMSMIGQRTNEVMKVLTIVATMFIPLTFIAGVYGMNFDTSAPTNMPELGWRYGYLFFWVLCAVLVVVMLWGFRRLGWLGGSSAATDE